jgi:hypothetical protein
MTLPELRNRLRAAVINAGGVAAWCRTWTPPISPAYVGDVLNGRRDPGPAILDVLNLRRETFYFEITDNGKGKTEDD